MILKSFVLVGVIMSYDPMFATVEFNLNPATNGGPSIAIIPKTAIPCKILIGTTIYVVKDEKMEQPHITCELDTK